MIGDRSNEHDPRLDARSEALNLLGERAQPEQPSHERGGSAGQFPPNQLPVNVNGPFGALAPGQSHGQNRIMGENTMGHLIGSELRPGAGLPDTQPEIPAHVDAKKHAREKQAQMLQSYAHLAANIQTVLLEAYLLDPAHFHMHFSHLRRVNLPLPTPDPRVQPGVATFEAVLASAPRSNVGPRRAGTDHLGRDARSPAHPDHVPLSEEQKLLPYSLGGLAGLDRDRASWLEIPWEEAQRINKEARRRELEKMEAQMIPGALPVNSPKPWKGAR